VPAVLVPVIQKAAGGRSDGPLFPTSTGGRRPAQMVAKAWKAVTREAKVPRLRPHNLRHSVATALIGAGVPLPDVARFIGDTVATLVRVYAHPTGVNPVTTLNSLYGGQSVGKNGRGRTEPQKTQAMLATA
jgi:integrase